MNFADRINEKNEAAKYNKNDEEVFTLSELDEAVIKINSMIALTCLSGPFGKLSVKDVSMITTIMAQYVDLLKQILKGDI